MVRAECETIHVINEIAVSWVHSEIFAFLKESVLRSSKGLRIMLHKYVCSDTCTMRRLCQAMDRRNLQVRGRA